MKNKDKWQQELRAKVSGEVDAIQKRCIKGEPLPVLEEKNLETILALADILCLLRAMPIEGTAMQPELSSRVAQQLVGIAQARAFASGRPEIDESDLTLLRRIVMDSLPILRRRLVYWMYKRGDKLLSASIEQIVSICGSSAEAVAPVLGQYVHSKLFRVSSLQDKENSRELYALTPEVFDLIRQSRLMDGEQVRIFEGIK